MKIISETEIKNFEFWSGGRDRALEIKSDEDWKTIEYMLEELYPEGITDTQLNDIFWFDFDTLAEWLGYESECHYFYGAAKDEDEMFDVIKESFPNANDEAVTEWTETEWDKSDREEICLKEFEEWYYSRYARSTEWWIDMVFEKAEGTIAHMKEFIADKDLNEKTAEEWVDEYNEWVEDKW